MLELRIPPTTVAPAPAPTATPSVAPDALVHTVLHSVLQGVARTLTSSPWLTAGFAVLLVIAVGRVFRKVVYPSGPRDPLRLFTSGDKATILARAGGRCESHSAIVGRCQAVNDLQADHVIPWSRSGRTAIENGQALCKQHNRAKSAKVPFKWQRRALDKRRQSYL